MSSMRFQKAHAWSDILRAILVSENIDHLIIVLPSEGVKAFTALPVEGVQKTSMDALIAMLPTGDWLVAFRARRKNNGSVEFFPVLFSNDRSILEYSFLETYLSMGGLKHLSRNIFQGECNEVESED